MSKYAYGIKSFKISDIDPATGLAVPATTKEVKEDIFRETFSLVEEQGTTTDLYSEMDPTPKISFTEQGKETITFSIMETRPATLQLFLGGEVVTADGRDTWSKPDTFTDIYKHFEIETLDGTIVTSYRTKVMGRKNFQLRRNNIWLIEVTATPLTPEVDGLAPLDISRATAL